MKTEAQLILEAYQKQLINEADEMRKEIELEGFKVKFVVVRDRDWEQWIVKVYINGKYDEDQSYFTDDKEDAINTMKHMSEHFSIPKKYKK